MTQFTHSPDVFGFGKGVTEEEKERAGELLARAALLRAQAATDELIKSYTSLVSVDAMGNIILENLNEFGDVLAKIRKFTKKVTEIVEQRNKLKN